MYLYENATVVTDENGVFCFCIYRFSGQLSISKTGYESKTVLLSEEKTHLMESWEITICIWLQGPK